MCDANPSSLGKNALLEIADHWILQIYQKHVFVMILYPKKEACKPFLLNVKAPAVYLSFFG
jgi:hypothetical protein